VNGADVPTALDRLATILAQKGVAHAFGGAIAQNYWGVVRATQDVDVLALIPSLRLQEVVDALNAGGFCLRDSDGKDRPITVASIRESMQSLGLFAVWLGVVKVKVFTPILPLQHRILERAMAMPWRDRTIPVTTAEDLIVLKMVFHRPKDLHDIRAMVATVGGHLDLTYLTQQAEQVLERGAMDELRRLLTQR
jgi:hypothetical protein